MTDETQGQANDVMGNPITGETQQPTTQAAVSSEPAPQADPPPASESQDLTLLSLIRRMSAMEKEIDLLKDRLQRRGIR